MVLAYLKNTEHESLSAFIESTQREYENGEVPAWVYQLPKGCGSSRWQNRTPMRTRTRMHVLCALASSCRKNALRMSKWSPLELKRLSNDFCFQ